MTPEQHDLVDRLTGLTDILAPVDALSVAAASFAGDLRAYVIRCQQAEREVRYLADAALRLAMRSEAPDTLRAALDNLARDLHSAAAIGTLTVVALDDLAGASTSAAYGLNLSPKGTDR